MYWYRVLIPASVFTLSKDSSFLSRNTAGGKLVKNLLWIPVLLLGLKRWRSKNSVTEIESFISMKSLDSLLLLLTYLAIAVFTTENSPSAVSWIINENREKKFRCFHLVMHGFLCYVRDGQSKFTCKLPYTENHSRVPKLAWRSVSLKIFINILFSHF